LEVYDFNPRAIAAYRKAGFVEDGRFRDSLRWDDEWHDTIVMSRLVTDPVVHLRRLLGDPRADREESDQIGWSMCASKAVSRSASQTMPGPGT